MEIMSEEQRRWTVTYAGAEYKLPASEAQKVIDALSSQVPTRVAVEVGTDRTLWLTFGPGVAATVLEDRRAYVPPSASVIY